MSKIMRQLYEEARQSTPARERKRYSADEHDSGFSNYLDVRRSGRKLIVRLDGVEQQMVNVADEVEGYIIRAHHPLEIVRTDIGDDIRRDKLFGLVECEAVPQ